MQLVGEAEGCSIRKRFISLIPSSMWRPCGRLVPPQQPAVAEVVGLLGRVEHADLVDPAAKVGADADVGRGGHEVVGAIAGSSAVGRAAGRRPPACSSAA